MDKQTLAERADSLAKLLPTLEDATKEMELIKNSDVLNDEEKDELLRRLAEKLFGPLPPKTRRESC